MDIDLSLLHSKTVEEIDITNSYSIPKEYFENTEIKELNHIQVKGKISIRVGEDLVEREYVDCTIIGNMVLEDSISLEFVEYPFSIEYHDFLEQNCKKTENILDIFQFLWENIVLEIPLQFTKVQDLSKFHGDGWRLVREDEVKNQNNPFNDLLKDFKEE